MQNYEKLPIYQKSLDLVDEIYELIKDFPKDERYGLCDQTRRAVVSIPLNIAEGQGRLTKKDNRQFVVIARGSLYELGAILDICRRRGFIAEKKRAKIGEMMDDLLRQLGGYIGYLGKKRV